MPHLELIAATASFVGSHLLLSQSLVRAALAGKLGERTFLALYSAAAIALLWWMIRSYAAAPLVVVWLPVAGLHWVPFVVMPLALVLVVAGVLSPNPTAVMQQKALRRGAVVGALSVTRHPVMWGVALWALSHLLVNTDVASMIFFGGLATLALGGAVHIDARRRRSHPEAFPPFAAATSFVPFVALATRRARLKLDVRLWATCTLGVAAYIALMLLHGRLFGVALLR